MRKKLTLWLIPVAVFIAAAVLAGWFKGSRLQERYGELRQQQEEMRRLRVERAYLRGRLAEAERRATPVPAPVRADESHRAEEPPVVPSLVPGEWTPSASWRNEGRKTAQATVATLLWAAAGGDQRAWQSVLEFDDAAHAQARELYARLSPVVRSQYASAEDLVASVAMTKVPVTEAQLMWLRQADDDYAVAGLRLANPDRQPNLAPARLKTTAAEPPRLLDQNQDKMVVLTLHRTRIGWRVMVPASAIERMASELTAPAAKL